MATETTLRAVTIGLVLALSLMVPVVPAVTAQEMPEIYGSQLMTEQERLEHRQRMQSARTQAEREQIRAEHHARMKERAKERGIVLPDEPPAPGMGMGRQQGMGQHGMDQHGMGRSSRQGLGRGGSND